MKRIRQIGKKANFGLQIVAVGGLTGAFAGVIVTCFVALVEMSEEFAMGYYRYFFDHPALIPLLFLALLLGSVVVGGVLMFIPMMRGSGFPQTEGACAGLMRYKWYQVLPAMFATSLLCIFMGLSAGAEGPGLFIGGACGYGLSSVTRRGDYMRRYLITGGACAGLSVALNAPFTGIIFAYEEAYKRFTPEVFACSCSSVIVAIIIRTLLAPVVGLSTGPVFGAHGAIEAFNFVQTGLDFLPFVLLAAVILSLAGVACYYLILLSRKLFHRIRLGKWKYFIRTAIPFLLAGAAGLICLDAMGSGLHFMKELSQGEQFTAMALLLMIALRYVVTVVNVGAELPSCASFPMMAIGAAAGALFGMLFRKMGMNSEYEGVLIVVCLVTFFSTVVRAPFTGIIMAVELTWNFTALLPVILSIAISFLIGSIFHTQPLYEKLLEETIEENKEEAKPLTVTLRVTVAPGTAIRDILWPYSALVTQIRRGEELIVPQGETEFAAGDIITVEGAPADREEYLKALAVIGDILAEESAPETPPAEEENIGNET